MAEIFLMEDSPPLRRVITRYLRDAGHNVTAFENGSVSRDGDMMSRADVLVTDLSMPEVDGRQALGNIHLLRPDLPVIVMTGVERFADPVLDTAFGYLKKPFHEHELLDLIDRAMEKRTFHQNKNESDIETNTETEIENMPTASMGDPAQGRGYSTVPASFCDPIEPLPLSTRLRQGIARFFRRTR